MSCYGAAQLHRFHECDRPSGDHCEAKGQQYYITARACTAKKSVCRGNSNEDSAAVSVVSLP